MPLEYGAETTRRALALLTVAHEVYSSQDDDVDTSDIDLDAVLADENGEVDWRDIALGMSIVAHLLLESVPDIVYDAAESTWGSDGKKLERITGTRLLQMISLHLSST